MKSPQALPAYLRQYVVEQKYDSYTAQDHAVWRYIMRQNRAFFKTHALPIYLQGLERTGLPIDRIPRVSQMNERLAELEWGAVPVRGFIPPAAFLDFQARGVLPIACDMRTIEHMAYTPAPDIVHEAAGHAPILADPQYAHYLHRYAAMARKALRTPYDSRLYEAVRLLSDIKENPDTPTPELAAAEAALKALAAQTPEASELAQVTRMNWWTVEYGLMGELKAPRIYGAGLLSSVGESQACLSDKVRKIPLSVDCVTFAYDITEPQPQLFVARDMAHLIEVLEAFEKTLSFRIGGAEALRRGREAAGLCTVQLDSGLQISGVLDAIEVENEKPSFFKVSGPAQIALHDQELPGHGTPRHAHGFSSPIGRWAFAPERDPKTFTVADLERAGVKKGQTAELRYQNGFVVRGKLRDVACEGDRIRILTWTECTVVRGKQTYFEPAWGEFDLVVGTDVTSVFGGSADPGAYGEAGLGKIATSPARSTPYTETERRHFTLFAKIRALREAGGAKPAEIETVSHAVLAETDAPWLLALECLELLQTTADGAAARDNSRLRETLRARQGARPHDAEWIQKGIALAAQA